MGLSYSSISAYCPLVNVAAHSAVFCQNASRVNAANVKTMLHKRDMKTYTDLKSIMHEPTQSLV